MKKTRGETAIIRAPGQIIERKKVQKENLEDLIRSTYEYYSSFVDYYVGFYDKFLISKDGEKYRDSYEKVAQILRSSFCPDQLVLDLGGGIGRWTVLLSEKCTYVVNIDQSLNALMKCTKRSIDFSVKHYISLIRGHCLFLPFCDNTFDGATMNWIIAHIPYEKRIELMNELKRVTKKRGCLIISDSRYRGQEGGKEQAQIRCVERRTYNVYKYYYDPEELKNLVESNFGVVKEMVITSHDQVCIAYRQ